MDQKASQTHFGFANERNDIFISNRYSVIHYLFTMYSFLFTKTVAFLFEVVLDRLLQYMTFLRPSNGILIDSTRFTMKIGNEQ